MLIYCSFSEIVIVNVVHFFVVGGYDAMPRFHQKSFAFGLATLGCVLAAGPAVAGRSVIDGSSTPITVCTFGAGPCSSTLLQSGLGGLPGPLAFNFGFGSFNSLFIYSNGLVSIGAPIAANADLTSLSTIGGNVFTPGYAPGRSFSLVTIQGVDASTNDNPGSPVVRVNFCLAGGNPGNLTSCNSDDGTAQFSIYDLGAGKYELQYNYGAFSTTDPPVFFGNAYAGYSFGGNSVQQSGTALQRNVTNLVPFNYFFPAAAPALPEPASWAMMLFGFATVGATQRRKRHGRSLTALA